MLQPIFTDTIKKKVLDIKGNKTYENLASEIKSKTGKNVHYTSIQKIATGERVPSLEMLSILAQYGGINLKDFF